MGTFSIYVLTQICNADMKILALEPLQPGSDLDAFVWRKTWPHIRLYEPEHAANIVAACAVLHNLHLSEGDIESDDDSDDDISSSTSSELDSNSDPIPHSLPRNMGSRMHYLRG